MKGIKENNKGLVSSRKQSILLVGTCIVVFLLHLLLNSLDTDGSTQQQQSRTHTSQIEQQITDLKTFDALNNSVNANVQYNSNYNSITVKEDASYEFSTLLSSSCTFVNPIPSINQNLTPQLKKLITSTANPNLVLSTTSFDTEQCKFSQQPTATKNNKNGKGHTTCEWQFDRYEASQWEQQWLNNIGKWKFGVCQTLHQQPHASNSLIVLQLIKQLSDTISNRKPNDINLTLEQISIFSRFYYKLVCYESNSNKQYVKAYGVQLIEPLIGMLRDPSTICDNILPNAKAPFRNPNYIQSKQFVMLTLFAPFTMIPANLYRQSDDVANNDQMLYKQCWIYGVLPPWKANSNSYYNGNNNDDDNNNNKLVEEKEKRRKMILMDLGSSYFGSWHSNEDAASSLYFYKEFNKKSYYFNKLIAMEINKLDELKICSTVPPSLINKFVFINLPVTQSKLNYYISKFNDNKQDDSIDLNNVHPFYILLKEAKERDFVTLKLDIDTPSIENELVDQLLNKAIPDVMFEDDDSYVNIGRSRKYSRIVELIDEMTYEHHVMIPEMHKHWGYIKDLDLRHSYSIFSSLRHASVRMHSWP